MGLVTVFMPFKKTGDEETVVQADGQARFVVDCNVKSVEVFGHVKMTFSPQGKRVSCGALTTSTGMFGPIPKLVPSVVMRKKWLTATSYTTPFDEESTGKVISR